MRLDIAALSDIGRRKKKNEDSYGLLRAGDEGVRLFQEGALLTVDDSGYKQGYEAMKLAVQILERGTPPAELSSYTPQRGAVILNRARAKMLGLDIRDTGFVEEYIDTMLALKSRRFRGQ